MNFVFLDTETGGLEQGSCALLSIGAVALRISEGKLLPLEGDSKPREFEVSLKPHPKTSVGAIALGVQGIGWSDLEASHRLDESEGLTRLGEWLSGLPIPTTYDWPIWCHNAEFDRGFLSAAIWRSTPKNYLLTPLCGRDATWGCTRYMAQALAARGLMAPRPANFKLDTLCQKFGIPLDSRKDGHGALVDAKLGARVLEKLLALEGGK